MTKRKAEVIDDEPAPAALPPRAPADVLADLRREIAALPGLSPSGVETAAERMTRLMAELQGMQE